jgi:L-threonylcarbamoyladenylate synthase
MAEISTDIVKAATLLRHGRLVAIPTETVYGLAGNGLDSAAVLDIFKVKQRPAFDPLILHVADPAQLEPLVTELPVMARRLAEKFWPGPLTLLLNKAEQVPDLVTSGLPRVAVRIPAHGMTLKLLGMLEFPLAAPSANPFGYVSPTTAMHVQAQLGADIPMILDGGACEVGIESTIIGFEAGQPIVYRLGGLSLEKIESVVGSVTLSLNQSSNPAAPGMLKSHYAPRKPLILGDLPALISRHSDLSVGVLSFSRAFNPETGICRVLSTTGSLEEAATQLFAALRALDQAQVDIIVAEFLPDQGLGRAINDRLRRAAADHP